MTPERLRKVEEIYHAVLEILPQKREQYLKEYCGEDAELRLEIESLLSFENVSADVIDKPPVSLVTEVFAGQEKHLIGKQINQYKIISLLGEGGMGAVFLAQDTKLERKVAVKFLSDSISKDSNRLKRFFQEAKSASALNHPNIITVHEIGEIDNKPFIVTEFINGKTLSQYLTLEKLTLGRVLEIATQIVSALTTAHEAGIIHRDIKPDNIMIRNDGIVKVLDFGLAKLSQETAKIDAEAATQLKKMTVDGMILGTPQYMSPEQARGQKVDLRTDVFSFGVLLYEMISGKQPFDGINAIDTIGSILKDEPPPLREYVPEISADLEHIVSKSLRKDREQRYQHIKDLLIDLNDVKKTVELDIKANTASIKPQNTKVNSSIVTLRRFSLAHAFGFLLIVVLSFGTIGWFISKRNNRTESILKTEEVVNWTSSPGEVYSVGSFSPDGKMVAFTSTKVGTKNIWIKRTASGEAIQITKDEFKNEQPIWSPNGEELAFYSTKGNQSGFWRVPVLGGSPKLITAIDDGSSRLRFWSKNNLIYYDSNNELYAVDAISGQKKQITDLVSKGIKATSLNLSPDEKTAAYVTVDGETSSVWIIDTAGETPKKLFDTAAEVKNIAWHPDNKRLFYSAVINGTFQIFVTDITGTPPRQISNYEQDSLVLDVSADGTKILYGSAKEESDVWGINLKDDKEFIVASDIDSELWADVSPDGKTLAYQSVKNLSQGNKLFGGSILTKTLGTNEQPVELAKNGGLPKWSPDGKTLSFIRISGEKYQLQTTKTLGSEQKQLTKSGISAINTSLLPYDLVQTSDFSWSPDSNKIAFTSGEGGSSNIWLVSSDGSNEARLTENKDSNLNLYCPLWSTDGKQIAFTTKTNNSEGAPSFGVRIINTETKKNDPILNDSSFIRLVGWSQSGRELLLVSVKGIVVGLPPEVLLQSLDIATGKMRQIAVLKDAYLYNIYLSPDKKSIAFAAHREEKDNIWIMPAAGGEAKKVTANNDSRLYFSSLAWSPDGSSIFFGKQLRYSLLSMLTDFQ